MKKLTKKTNNMRRYINNEKVTKIIAKKCKNLKGFNNMEETLDELTSIHQNKRQSI